MQMDNTAYEIMRKKAFSPSGNNLTLVKYCLAIMIVVGHFAILSDIDAYIPSLFMRRVSLFYTISGLLAFNTLSRDSSTGFMVKRIKRLCAPYYFIVLACALGLSLISTYDTADYFFSRHFWRYLAANITFLNFIEPTLPGVFEESGLVFASVNGALWTMKGLVFFLFTAPLIAWCINKLGKRGMGPAWVIVPIIILSIGCRLAFYLWSETPGGPSWEVIKRMPPCQICYFYIGSLVYFYFRQFKRLLPAIAAISLIFMIVYDLIPYYQALAFPVVESMVMLCAAFALNRSLLPSWLPDTTYQIYLFHWPIIQVILLLALPPLQALIITMVSVIVLAYTYVYLERRCFRRPKPIADVRPTA